MNDEEVLKDLYYKKHVLDGINSLYKKAKVIHPNIKKDFVKEWLKKQEAHQQTTVTPIIKKQYLPIYSDVPYAFQIDLTFFPRYTDYNKGYNVLFTAINVNTRFVYAYIAKKKDSVTILDLVKKMAEKTVINTISCDSGGEFNNQIFINYCAVNNITLYFITDDSHKLGIINRFHRTLKEKLSKYFVASNSVVWYNVIDDIIYNYNHSVNRGIGIEPYKVNAFIENEIVEHKKSITGNVKATEKRFNIGDKVRIKKKNDIFEDKMLPKYSKRVYTIVKTSANSLTLINDGKEKKVKKSTVIKIDEIESNDNDDNNEPVVEAGHINNNVVDAIDIANREHKIKNKLKKAGMTNDDIVHTKRVKKANIKLNI